MDVYLATLDFSKAMQEKIKLEDLEQRLKTLNNSQTEAEQMQVYEQLEPIKEVKDTIYERRFWVKGTKEQLQDLGRYMKENNINYGGIQ
jgi:uncharacterized coiled-coil protein SlyX